MRLSDFYQRYPTQEDCLRRLEKLRWNSIPKCPYCRSSNCSGLPKESRHHCNNCNTTFSVTVGTIFHHTKADLQKWFMAILLILHAKKGLSVRRLAEDLEVNKNTAWLMRSRISNARRSDQRLLTRIIDGEISLLTMAGSFGGRKVSSKSES